MAMTPAASAASANADPIAQWMEERRQAFRDFALSPFRTQHQHSAAAAPPVPTQQALPYFGASGGRGGGGPPQQQHHYHPYSNFPSHSATHPFYSDTADTGPLVTHGRRSRDNNLDDMLSARDRDSELSPKARVSYDEAKFQVEFDVRDFRPEELSIKTEGDVLVVLAKHETKTENGGSFVSRQFEQRFTLPSGVRPESISSSLAKDGTLTITAPRDVPAITGGGRYPVDMSNPSNSPALYGQSASQEDEGLPHPRVRYDEDKFQISLDCHRYRPEELDVKVEGNSIIITAKQEIKETGGTRTRVFEQKFTLPSGVRAEKVTSSFGKDGVLSITAPRGSASSASAALRGPAAVDSIEHRMDKTMSPSKWNDDYKYSPGGTGSHVVSKPSGGSIFDRHRHSPPSSVDHHGHHGSGSGHEGGISKITYDDDSYKILINVADFAPEELIIKTVGNTVHFEAKHEEKTSDGHSYTSRNVSQSFTLPKGVDPEAVTSSMSKDGLLTISAPLPPALRAPHGHERLVPIKHR